MNSNLRRSHWKSSLLSFLPCLCLIALCPAQTPEPRHQGEDFKFRDAYAFTRAETPSMPSGQAGAPAKPLVGDIAAHPDWPVAKAEDVSSVDAIVSAVYNVISGAKGQARDWNRMRSLFLPSARLIPARANAQSPGHTDAVILSIDDYIARSSGTMMTNGFFERSIRNDVEQFGNIVQIWSTYESRHGADDAAPFARGINSIQLLKDGDRYWVIGIVWDSERAGNPIPAKYLP